MASTTPLGFLGTSRPSVQTPTHGAEVPSTPALPCVFQGGANGSAYPASFGSPSGGARTERVMSTASTLDLDAPSSSSSSSSIFASSSATASSSSSSSSSSSTVDNTGNVDVTAVKSTENAPLSPGAGLTAPSEDLGTFTFAGKVDATRSPPCHARPPPNAVPMLSREDLESVDVLVSLMLLGRGGARPAVDTVRTAASATAAAGPTKKRKVGRPLGSYRRERATIDEEDDMPPLSMGKAAGEKGKPSKGYKQPKQPKQPKQLKEPKEPKEPKRARASSTASSQGPPTKRRRASSTGSSGGPRLHSVATRLGYCACRECTKKIEPTQQRLAYCGSRCQVREQNLRQRRVKNCNPSLVEAKDSLLERLIAASPDRHGLETMLEMERAERVCA